MAQAPHIRKFTSLSSKAWVGIYTLALAILLLLTSLTVNIVTDVSDEIKKINSSRIIYVYNLINSEVTGKINAIEVALYSLKSLKDTLKKDHDLSYLVDSMVANIPVVKNLVIFNADGDSIHHPTGLPNINVSDRAYFQFHQQLKNNTVNKTQYVSDPFIGRMKGEKIFTLSFPIKNTEEQFSGIYLASISPEFFDSINHKLNYQGLNILVSSTRTNDIFYGELNNNSEPLFTLYIENTPFKFDIFDIKDDVSIFEYIIKLNDKMITALLTWGGLSLFLLTVSLFLLKQQFKVSKEYMHLSNYDHLTELYNRRAFITLIHQELQRCLRYKGNLALIIIDIDHFKSVNDTYGHDCGDAILKQFAQLLKNRTRETDILARIGGEEFVVLLPETKLEGALVAAKKYQKAVEKNVFTHKKFIGECTASFGVASLELLAKENITIEHLMHIADTALYDAKKTRNTVKAASPEFN